MWVEIFLCIMTVNQCCLFLPKEMKNIIHVLVDHISIMCTVCTLAVVLISLYLKQFNCLTVHHTQYFNSELS